MSDKSLFVAVPSMLFHNNAMLSSTERSSEIKRQRRNQLQRVDHFRYTEPTVTEGRVTRLCSPPSSGRFIKGLQATTSDGSRSTMADLNDVQRTTSDSCLNNDSGGTQSNDGRKLENRNTTEKRVRVRRHDSIISDPATSSVTKTVPDVIAAAGSTTSNNSATKLHRSDAQRRYGRGRQTTGGHLTLPASPVKLPGRKATSQSPATDTGRRNSSDRRGIGRRHTSRLDRHVYQCYFAGILHSSRRSERFMRLQQLYAVLENIVEIESEISLHQQIVSPASQPRICQPPDYNQATNSSEQKHWRQRLLELRKLYAKLEVAQDDKEFFYDNGHLDSFQWKSWRDLGLSRKSSSLTKLKDLFEAAMMNNRSASTTSTSLQHVQHGVSYKKLLGMFQRLEKKARRETEASMRWQSSSQQSLAGERKLDGTYIKMMESAARNTKSLALHGYHMNEHRNRYDVYVQSRRIYRPKSAPNIFEPSSSDDQLETDEIASSDRTASTARVCENGRYCSVLSAANSASDFTDSLYVSSSVTSIDSAPDSSVSAQYRQADTSPKQQSCPTVVVPSTVKECSTEEVNRDKELTQQQVVTDDTRHVIVDELEAAAATYDNIGSKPKSSKRKRHRPRCRNEDRTTVRSTDTLSAVTAGSHARRHIDAWRRSTRPLSGTLNKALEYFNSLCIDENRSQNGHSTLDNSPSDSVVSPNENNMSQTGNRTNSTDSSNQLTPPFSVSVENEERSVEQFADREKKFSSEIKLDVDSCIAVFDRHRIVLPQLYSCGDEVHSADCSHSNAVGLSLPTCFRAANIDKRRHKCTVDATEPSSQRRGYSVTDSETVGVRSQTSHGDVIHTPEVFPTYAKPAQIVRMRSESHPTQTTVVSSPELVDSRQAVVRKIPTMNDRIYQASSDHIDRVTSSASNPVARQDNTSADKLIDLSSLDNEAKQVASRIDCPKSEATAAVTASQKSSFICRGCCRPLASCSCAVAAEIIASEKRSNDITDRHQSDGGGKSVSSKYADDDFMSASWRFVHVDCEPSQRAVGSPDRARRRITDNGSRLGGRRDVEMQRMMDCLATIDSEWTSGRPTRSTQPVHQASDMNNNSSGQARRWNNGDINDRRRPAQSNQHARQASTTSSGHNGDLFSQYSATWMLYGDDGFVNNNGSNTADSVNCTTDHDDSRATAINAPHPRVTEFTRDNQTHSVQRLCVQYNYSPRHADELELNKGDIINLVDVCDDGWFLGTSQRTGQFGTFPGNYARPVQ